MTAFAASPVLLEGIRDAWTRRCRYSESGYSETGNRELGNSEPGNSDTGNSDTGNSETWAPAYRR
jgi:hypothetical protein